jgi:hypothetical protein
MIRPLSCVRGTPGVLGSAFPTAGHLAAYAGLAPVTRRSGTSIKGETRSQRGHHALKSALFLSAFASLSDPPQRRLLRLQTRERQAPQRSPDLPRTAPRRRHLRHAPRPPALQDARGRPNGINRLRRLTATIETPPGQVRGSAQRHVLSRQVRSTGRPQHGGSISRTSRRPWLRVTTPQTRRPSTLGGRLDRDP